VESASGATAGTDAQTSRLTAALDALRAHRTDLERLGVLHAGVFGSTACGDDRPDSDIDIVVELTDGARTDLFDLVDIQNAVRDAVNNAAVDVSFHNAMKPRVRTEASDDVVHSF